MWKSNVVSIIITALNVFAIIWNIRVWARIQKRDAEHHEFNEWKRWRQ